MSSESVVICALYRFAAVESPGRLRGRLLMVMQRNRVLGTVVVAAEGINGTIAGARDGVEAVLAFLRRQPGFADLEAGESFADAPPFKRARVKVRKEIVTLGARGVDVADAGLPVDAAAWNTLIDDDDVLVIDTRNEYETRIGGFDGAIDPHTTNFRDFPAFAARELAADKTRPIAMYCTGGIRCEKASAYLKQQGFEKVYQLQGGILNYLATTPAAESRWRGECFVFDERVAVDHQLQRGRYEQCHACRAPVSEADKRDSRYTPGASCPHCHGRVPAARREAFIEREKQVKLATARGREHFGPEAMADAKATDGADDAAGHAAGPSLRGVFPRRQNQPHP